MSLHFPPRVLSAPSVPPSVPPPPLDLTEPRERERETAFPPTVALLARVCLECSWRRQGGDSQPEKLQPRKPRGPFICAWMSPSTCTFPPHLTPLVSRDSGIKKRREKKNNGGREKNRERIKVRCGFCPLSHQRPRHPPSTRPQPTQLVNK